MTPNPQAMKFVTDIFLSENPIEYSSPEKAEGNLLAKTLFGFPGIKNVFIVSNFITLTKEGNDDWYEMIGAIREAIRNYFLSNDVPVLINAGEQTAPPAPETVLSTEIEKKIKGVLEEYVRPAVEHS